MNRKRILDYGIRVGCLPTGPLDKITDVPGVTVGHATVRDARHHTGVTVIMPCEDNMFAKKLTAASFVLNGFGKPLTRFSMRARCHSVSWPIFSVSLSAGPEAISTAIPIASRMHASSGFMRPVA